MTRCVVSLIAVLLSGSVSAATEAYPLPQERIHHFLNALLGPWDGEAVETPVGSVDYDITFQECDDGAHVGVAETGASLHYWRFFEVRGGLRLRFMSTFAGNRQSTLLLPSGIQENAIRLFAPQQEILTLNITPERSQIDIRVFHWGKPHVRIVLERKTSPQTPPAHGELCSQLPPSLLEP